MIAPRTIALVADLQKQTAINAISNLPVGQNLEVVIRETVKARTPDQNALMHAGPLNDIAQQAWVNGRQFDALVWHEFMKEQHLPDEFIEPNIHELVKNIEKYQKWAIDPAGKRRLVGSTTQLSKRGFGIYLEQIYAYGASLGVQFTAVQK